jgi:hypothetical protein
MEAAYAKPTYEGAKKALIALKPELELMNQSALSSHSISPNKRGCDSSRNGTSRKTIQGDGGQTSATALCMK